MSDGRRFTDIYEERRARVNTAAEDRLRREAFNYWAFRDVPPRRIIGEDSGFGGPYSGGQPQWLRIYEERRRRAEEARFDSLGRGSLYGDPRSRPNLGRATNAPEWGTSYDPYDRAQRQRLRLATTTFATHDYRVNGQPWRVTQMANGDVYRDPIPVRSPEPSTPLGNQKLQIADDPKEPNFKRIEGNLHDVRFVDGCTLDSRILAGRLTTSVSHEGRELFRCKKNENGTVSEVSWTQDGQRFSMAYNAHTGSWQTSRGDRLEMRPIAGAGLQGWNIDSLDSRGRMHCSNGKPGEHSLIGRNMKQMIKLDEREYDEYKKTGKLPDRWEALDLLTPKRAGPAAP
jgi:hypothetical protein